jgi:hypothetical protein
MARRFYLLMQRYGLAGRFVRSARNGLVFAAFQLIHQLSRQVVDH